MKKEIIIASSVLGILILGNIVLQPNETYDEKCGALVAQTVDIEKQEFRQKYANCDEEFIVTAIDIGSKSEIDLETEVKSKLGNNINFIFDKNGKLENVINYEN